MRDESIRTLGLRRSRQRLYMKNKREEEDAYFSYYIREVPFPSVSMLSYNQNGEPPRNRTENLEVKSLLLYLLS